MQITPELVEKLAHLARLHFDEKEKEEISRDLEKMIEMVDKLKELDVNDTEPLLHMSQSTEILRNDEVKKTISREQAFMNAPDHNEEFFRVPKILKNPGKDRL